MYFAFISSFLSRNVFFGLHLARQLILHSDGLLISQPIENCLWGAVPEWFVAKTVVEVAAS